ncbi:MAG: hypothetical protein QM820_50505 [Minicystis sp.]
MRRAAWLLAVPALLAVGQALAGPADAGASDAGATAADAGSVADAGAAVTDGGATDTDGGAADGGADTTATCIEHVPPGATRPAMREEMPARGFSGYAAELRLVITHGRGEKVLPDGFRFQSSSDAGRALEKAGFTIPDPTGGAAPTLKVEPGESGKSITTLTIPVVPLPEKGGRNTLTLPPLPIAIGRANNEYITLCTSRHTITVEDPIANVLDPKVKPNPPPRPQREDWPLARYLAIGVPIGIALALLGLWLYRWWQRRPKPEIEKPKIPPWIIALRELEEIRDSDLLKQGKTDAYFDRVSDSIRRYLGGRYGFETTEQGYNGLETTTAEMLELLRRVRPPITELPRIKEFLDECDLVKFARLQPTEEMCLEALSRGEIIVRRTIPVMVAAVPPDGARPPNAEASS